MSLPLFIFSLIIGFTVASGFGLWRLANKDIPAAINSAAGGFCCFSGLAAGALIVYAIFAILGAFFPGR